MKDSDKNTNEYPVFRQRARAAMSAGEMSEEEIQHLKKTQMDESHKHLDQELDDQDD